MSFLICNGSPRGKQSNSQVISSWIHEPGDKTILVKSIKKFPEYLDDLKSHDNIVFIYPLYVDGMPGIVKAFFEFIEDNKAVIENKHMLFIVHCGFNEAVHLRVVERYHKILADIYNLKSVNTILSPGSEGIRLMPEKMNQKRKTNIVYLSDLFRQGKTLPQATLNALAGNETISKSIKPLFKVLEIFGLTNMYWNKQLRKNDVYSNRFDKPYEAD